MRVSNGNEKRVVQTEVSINAYCFQILYKLDNLLRQYGMHLSIGSTAKECSLIGFNLKNN